MSVIEFRQLLKSVALKTNCAILISSHILSELAKLCDRFIFISEGKIVSISENLFAENSNFTGLESFSNDPNSALDTIRTHFKTRHFQLNPNQLIVYLEDYDQTKLSNVIRQHPKIQGFREITSPIEKEYSKVMGGSK